MEGDSDGASVAFPSKGGAAPELIASPAGDWVAPPASVVRVPPPRRRLLPWDEPPRRALGPDFGYKTMISVPATDGCARESD